MRNSIDVAALAVPPVEWRGSGDGIEKSQAVKQRAAEEASARDINTIVSQLNASLKIAGTKLQLSVDDVTKQTVITVVDQDTGEVIRQIPSETILKISQNITRRLGALFDKEV